MLLLACLCGHAQSIAPELRYPMSIGMGEGLTYLNFMSMNFSDDVNVARRLLYRADTCWQKQLSDTALSLANEAVRISMRGRYVQGVAHALNTIGIVYQQKGKHDSALIYFNKSLPFTRKTHNRRNLYRLYLNIAVSHFYGSQYGQSLENYLQALSLMEAGKPDYTATDSVAIYCNIGVIWVRLKAANQALPMFENARKIAERIKDTTLLDAVYARMGEGYTLKQDSTKARASFLKAMELARKNHNRESEVATLSTLAHIALDYGNTSEAYSFITDALRILDADTGAYPYYRLHTLHNLGMYYLQRKEYTRAEHILLPAFRQVKELGFMDMVPHMESDVAALYAAMGKYSQAYSYLRHYTEKKDSIFEEDRTRSLESWMQSRIHEKDKELVTKQLMIARQDNKLQSKNFILAAIIACTLFLLALFLLSVRSYRNRQQLQRSVIAQLKQEKEISQLKAQVRGEEQERNRLARELHDGIASHLWAIKLNVENLRQQEIQDTIKQQELAAIYQQLEDTTVEVRKTAHNLMPDILLEEGLANALASYCEKLGRQTDLEIDFMEYGVIPRMDEEIDISIYRMIQELIQNALKHAKDATGILVQISCTETVLNITVEDNGMGFPEDEPGPEGVGLKYIRKRVAALQGHMDVESAPGKGTTVYIEFDIRHLLQQHMP